MIEEVKSYFELENYLIQFPFTRSNAYSMN